ncbi:hypothetical protein IEE94_11050 [Yimella sp. cx-573]|nr:hypothetical protein [Yimella sp. cx-573]
MKRTLATAVAALMLTACGGSSDGGDADSTTESPTSTSAIRADGQYATIDDLRAAVREAGIQCPDSIWEPVAASTIDQAVGEGSCGKDFTIVSTTADGVPAANSALTNRYLDRWLDGDRTEFTFVQGATWVAMCNAPAAKILEAKMGGTRVQGTPTASAT